MYKYKMDIKEKALLIKVCKTQPFKIIHFGKGTMHEEFDITKEKIQYRQFQHGIYIINPVTKPIDKSLKWPSHTSESLINSELLLNSYELVFELF